VADIGLWEYDIENGTIHWSEETYRIWRYHSDEVTPSEKHFEDRIHPDDRERVEQQYKQSLADRQDYYVIYRLQFPDDSIKYVEAFGKHLYDEEGNPTSTIGTNQNVTERELEKRKLKTSLDKHQTTLDEIHHRVKNNLAVLAGTMQLQLLEESDERLKHTLLDSTDCQRPRTALPIKRYE
jgi:PAS domain S-box-containing protein